MITNIGGRCKIPHIALVQLYTHVVDCSCIFLSQDLEKQLLSNTSALNHRGPDTHSYRLHNFGRDSQALFYGTVLHFRGSLTSQPLQGSENGNVLLWNGEIFGGIEVIINDRDCY